MDAKGWFPLGVKLPGRESNTHLHLVPASKTVELYLHSHMRLHGVVLNWLRTGTTLLFFSVVLPAHLGPRPLIQFRNRFPQSVGLLGRLISPLQGLYLNTGQHKHSINAYTHKTSMPWVGFESTITASGRAKTVDALDRSATVTGTTSPLLYLLTGVL
jgi:hypothetical protein